jgi:hypothetical protein
LNTSIDFVLVVVDSSTPATPQTSGTKLRITLLGSESNRLASALLGMDANVLTTTTGLAAVSQETYPQPISSAGSKDDTPMIVGAVVGSLGCILLIVAASVIIRRHRSGISAKPQEDTDGSVELGQLMVINEQANCSDRIDEDLRSPALQPKRENGLPELSHRVSVIL